MFISKKVETFRNPGFLLHTTTVAERFITEIWSWNHANIGIGRKLILRGSTQLKEEAS